MFRPTTRLQFVADIAAAVALGAFTVLLDRRGTSDLAYVAVVVLLTAALALRRRSPALALGTAWAGAVLQMTTGQSPMTVDLLIAGVMYAVGCFGGRRLRTAGLVSGVVGAVVAALYVGIPAIATIIEHPAAQGAVAESATLVAGVFAAVAVVLLLPWFGGVAAGSRRVSRVSREAQLLAERDAARADRSVAVEEERLRIARETHDIVAHSIAVVIAQADGARYSSKDDLEQIDRALSTISDSARGALGEVRDLLARLRYEQGLTPTADLVDLGPVIDEMRTVGLDVRFEQAGDFSALPLLIQLSLHRILREALTNAFKHGDTRRPVQVRVDVEAGAVGLRVSNRRRADGSTGLGTGNGLTGVRERAELSGGTAVAGPEGDDFVVRVRLPLPAAALPRAV